MPRPHARAKKLEEVQRMVCSGLCCIQTDDTTQSILVPSEPVSARPMSEPVSARPVSDVRFTPQTPTEPSLGLGDQVVGDHALGFERRLQSSIALIMEQQYERLSGEVLDIVRRSHQKMPLRTSGRSNGAALVPGRASVGFARSDMNGTSLMTSQPNGIIMKPMAPDNAPPLLKPWKSVGEAQATMNALPDPPAWLSPRASKLAKSSSENAEQLRNSQKADVSKPANPQKPCLRVNKQDSETVVDDFGRSGSDPMDEAFSMPATLTAISTVRTDIGGKSDHDNSLDSATQSRRPRLSSAVQNDNTVLADLLHAASLRQREKKAQANVRSKFRSLKVARNSLTGEVISRSLGRRILDNPLFDSLCALAIILNSILIGFSVEWLTTHDEETMALIFLGYLCNVFFLVELTFRLCVHRLNYFMNEDRLWNLFDFLLVLFSLIDFLLWATIGSNGAGSVGSTLKIVKMLRIVRIFRVFRFFRELSLLALMIMDSLRSLIWALLMLIIIIYVFAICFTQNATEYLRSDKNDASFDPEIRKLFGSLPKSINILVYSMLQGVSWGFVSDALMHMDAFSAMLFFFYIFFSVLAVLNIITGVFVDNAVETAKTEREFLVQKELELREKLLEEMEQLFGEMDEDKSGSVTYEELSTYFDDKRVQTYFHALGLDPSDCERLFRLIDTDSSGEIQVKEFLDGCIRLKGEARSIDVNCLIWQCRQIQSSLEKLDKLDVLDKLESELRETAVWEPGGKDGDRVLQIQDPKPRGRKGEQQSMLTFSSPDTLHA